MVHKHWLVPKEISSFNFTEIHSERESLHLAQTHQRPAHPMPNRSTFKPIHIALAQRNDLALSPMPIYLFASLLVKLGRKCSSLVYRNTQTRCCHVVLTCRTKFHKVTQKHIIISHLRVLLRFNPYHALLPQCLQCRSTPPLHPWLSKSIAAHYFEIDVSPSPP